MPRKDGVSKVTEMNRYALHNMVEYIKTCDEFPFDALDVEESLEQVLGYFGFYPQLDQEEREQLLRDLYPLAVGAELAEMHHLAEEQARVGLQEVGQTMTVWLRVLARQERSVTPAQFMEKLRLA